MRESQKEETTQGAILIEETSFANYNTSRDQIKTETIQVQKRPM